MKSKKMAARISAFVTAAVLVAFIGVYSFSSFAAEEVSLRDAAYALAQQELNSSDIFIVGEYSVVVRADQKAVLLKYSGDAENVVIPESFDIEGDEYPLECIGSFAFSGCTNLKSIKIPSAISKVEAYAFENCRLLEAIELVGDEAEKIAYEIDDKAFEGCRDDIIIVGNNAEYFIITSDTTTSDTTTSDTTTSDTTTSDTITSDTITSDTITSDTITSDTITSDIDEQEIQKPAVQVNEIKIGTIKFSKYSFNVTENTQLKLDSYLIVNPAGANEKISWYVDNRTIASVDENGTVTGLRVGNTKVYAQAKSGAKAYVSIYVRRSVSSIKIPSTYGEVYVGKTVSIKAKVYPTNAYNRKLVYTSSNPSAATVNASGKVKGVSRGKADITVKSTDGSEIIAVYHVTVKQQVVKIVPEHESMIIYCGQTAQINYSVYPQNADNTSAVFSSSNGKYATVDANGLITAVKAGSAYIVVRAADGKGAYKKIKLTVKAPCVEAGPTSVTLYMGKTLQLTPVIMPDYIKAESFAFASSNTKVLTVDENGNLTPHKNGTAYITVNASSNYIPAKIKVSVKTAVSSITLNQTSGEIYNGKSVTLKPSISPTNASNKKVTYETSDSSIATVNKYGKISGISQGTAYITVRAADGQGAECVYQVTVHQRVTSIKTSAGSLVLYTGKPYTLSCTALPENAYNSSLTYSSSNIFVAVVDANGVITPKGAGSAKITVKAADGQGASTRITVTVKNSVESIKLNETKKSLYVGNTFTIKPTISPAFATNKNVKYTTSNALVASVSSTGIVTGIGSGSAVITVSAADGQGASAQLNVTVNQTTLSLNATRIPLEKGGTFRLNASFYSTLSGVTYSYSSANNLVATVDSMGIITAVNSGKTTITAKTSDGLASCSVEVIVLSDGVHRGVDVSYVQQTITADDWKKVLDDGYEFAMIRAGYGRELNQKDKCFEQNYASAKAAGVAVGAYQYSYATDIDGITKEANTMLEWIKGKQFEYPIVLDMEEAKQAALGKDLISKMIETYCSILQEKGYYVAFYSYANFVKNNINSSTIQKYDVWLAHTNAASPNEIYKGNVAMWQYSHNGKVNGIKTNVDLNISYVNYPEIIKAEGKNGF